MSFWCYCSGTNPYIQAVYDLCHLVNVRFRTFPYHIKPIFHLSPHGYKFRKACNTAHRHTGILSLMSVLHLACISWSCPVLITLITFRGSYQEEEGSLEDWEGTGHREKQTIYGFSGYSSLCPSMTFPWYCCAVIDISSILKVNILHVSDRMSISRVYQMRTSGLRWTHSCSKAMTPQPAAYLGSCTVWLVTLSTSRNAGRRSCKPWREKTPWSGIFITVVMKPWTAQCVKCVV